MTQSFTTELFEGAVEITADVERTYAGCAARTMGPPEDCWPAEAAEYAIRQWYRGSTEIDLHAALRPFYDPSDLDKEITRCIDDVLQQADSADWNHYPEYEPEREREQREHEARFPLLHDEDY